MQDESSAGGVRVLVIGVPPKVDSEEIPQAGQDSEQLPLKTLRRMLKLRYCISSLDIQYPAALLYMGLSEGEMSPPLKPGAYKAIPHIPLRNQNRF